LGSAVCGRQPEGAFGGRSPGVGPPLISAFHPSRMFSVTVGSTLFMYAICGNSRPPRRESWPPRLRDCERSTGLMIPMMFFIAMVKVARKCVFTQGMLMM
jgi:hypothetical protein